MTNHSNTVLTQLQCPYCNSKFSKTNKKFILDWFTIRCECDEFPVLENIYYIIKDERQVHKKIIREMESNNYNKAIHTALSNESKIHRYTVAAMYALFFHFKVLISYEYIVNFFSWVGPHRSWFKYLRESQKRDVMQVALKLLDRGASTEKILDIGSGPCLLVSYYFATHPSSKKSFYCIDKSFFSLVLARLFKNPQAELLVCCDVEDGLPFRKNIFDTIMVLDTLAWIVNKERFFSNVSLLHKKTGALYILNVHDNLDKLRFIGYGISPHKLKKIISKWYKGCIFIKNNLTRNRIIWKTTIKQANKPGYSCVSKRV